MKSNALHGFSLMEVLVSMFLLTVLSLFLARLLLAGVHLNHISKDETRLNTIANDRLEQLKNMAFSNLGMPCLNTSTSCGNLDQNYTDSSVSPNVPYHDNSIPGYEVRWTITLPDGDLNLRRMTVRAISKNLDAIGKQREMIVYYDRTKY